MFLSLGALSLLLGCSSQGATQVELSARPPANNDAGGLSERAKIDRLLDTVRTSGIVFIRNGSEYDAMKAAEHLQTKLDAAGSEVKTATDFIDKLATKSSMSGEPYTVRLKDGSEMLSRDWLVARLKEIESAL
jgi:hypothetical protein